MTSFAFLSKEPEPVVEPEPLVEPEPEIVPIPVSAPVSEPEPAPEPIPVPQPEPEPQSEPKAVFFRKFKERIFEDSADNFYRHKIEVKSLRLKMGPRQLIATRSKTGLEDDKKIFDVSFEEEREQVFRQRCLG